MEVSKIHLSSAEKELMQNAEVILTKNRVLEKMKLLLESIQEKQIAFSENLTSEYFNIHPKISRGENYLGLPYLILDYPRHSTRDQFLFIRTMFWWGRFFSCTLHLSGKTKDQFGEKITQAYPGLLDFYISIGEDPWVHHLDEPAYKKIETMSRGEFEQSCKKLGHIKIAARHPLEEWEKAPDELCKKWKFFLSVCGLIA